MRQTVPYASTREMRVRGVFTPQKSKFSQGAVGALIVCVATVVLSSLLHRFGALQTPTFLVFLSTSFLALLTAICLGIVALRRIWKREEPGATMVLWTLAACLVLLAIPLSATVTLVRLPAINDLSTDTVNPPEFRMARIQRPNTANSLRYPFEFADIQIRHYPNVRPLFLGASPVHVFKFVQSVAKFTGWTIVRRSAPSNANSVGSIEAVDQTRYLGFRDDIIVRVRPVDDGTVVDVRSASRYGRHDFGTNANRISHFLEEVQDRVERDRLTH